MVVADVALLGVTVLVRLLVSVATWKITGTADNII
jgi:hypothetical protein